MFGQLMMPNLYRSTKLGIAIGALSVAASFQNVSAASASLVPPRGFTEAVQIKHVKEPYVCATPPKPFTGDLDFPSKYEGSGSARDQLNEESSAEYVRKTADIAAMEKGFEPIVRKYMEFGEPAMLDCALSWLSSWADAKALEAKAENHPGRAVRKFTLASLSSAYMRLKFSSSAPLRNDKVRPKKIEAWFNDLADLVVQDWPLDAPIKKINNHSYWVAWSLMSTAVLTNRRDLFDRSLAFYRIFETQIDGDGYLPNELARESRALGYHAYALAPLAMIAAFAKANGVDLTAEGDHALSRLAHRVANGNNDPASFANKVGVAQDPNAMSEKGTWVWLAPYCWTVTCEPALMKQLADSRPQRSTRLGGDLTAIFASDGAP